MNNIIFELSSVWDRLISLSDRQDSKCIASKSESKPDLDHFFDNLPTAIFDKIIGHLENREALHKIADLSPSIQRKVGQSMPVAYLQKLPKRLEEALLHPYWDGQIKAFFTQSENDSFPPIKALKFLDVLPWPKDLAFRLEDILFLSDHLKTTLCRQICLDETVKATLTYQNIEFLLDIKTPCPPGLVDYTDGALETYLRADEADLKLLRVLLALKSEFFWLTKS